MSQLRKGGLVRGHDKPLHGTCAIHFPGGIYIPRCSMYGLYTYIWVVLWVNVGKYTIHRASGIYIYIYVQWKTHTHTQYLESLRQISPKFKLTTTTVCGQCPDFEQWTWKCLKFPRTDKPPKRGLNKPSTQFRPVAFAKNETTTVWRVFPCETRKREKVCNVPIADSSPQTAIVCAWAALLGCWWITQTCQFSC